MTQNSIDWCTVIYQLFINDEPESALLDWVSKR